MKTQLVLSLTLFLCVVCLPTLAFSEALNIDLDQTVNAKLNGGLVSPLVGGITISLAGETYGGPNSDHPIVENPANNDGIWAGCYLFDIENLAIAYKSFCLDVTLDPATTFTEHAFYNATSEMEAIWGTFYDCVVDNAVNAAAFQLAMWELIHETSSTYDVTSGNFFLAELDTTSSNNNGADFACLTATANCYLNSANWIASADLLILDDGSHQPFLVAVLEPSTGVPEPSTLVLLSLLASFGSVFLIRRKR